MIRHVTKHWITSVIGAIGSGCMLVGPALISGQIDRTDVGLAMLLLVGGAILKDPEALK